MDKARFETNLRDDGFTEIELQTFEPRPGKGGHRHHFAIRGLVLSGAFIITRAGEPVTYGPGQVFDVAVGELHDESIGPEGAHVLVGRKLGKDRSGASSPPSQRKNEYPIRNTHR